MAVGRATLGFRPGRARLVGRTGELRVLGEALREAQQGQICVVMLAGDPGIGKSRLLEEFPPPELAQGVTVLRGGPSEAEGMPPYLPFLDALGEYVATARADALSAVAGEHAAVLATLLPGLAGRLGGPLQPLYPIGPEQEHLRLFDAVAGFLAGVAGVSTGGLVLALDDLQWADPASCELLGHVARRLAAQQARALVVGAYREAEAEENRALAGLLVDLNRRRLLVPLPLRPLGATDSGALAVALLHGELAPEVQQVLHAQSEGNPFFAEELLRALLEDGRLRQQDER